MDAMNNKKTLAPELRFKGFNGEITTIDLENVSTIRTGPFGSVLHQEDYAQEGTPIITVEHLSDQGIVHQNLPLVSDSDKERLKSYLLSEGDIVFSRVGSVDRNSIVSSKEDGWLFSGRLLRIRTIREIILPRFLSYYFQLEVTKHRIRSVAVGQTMASLNTEILKSFSIQFPKQIAEQQKIASFLSAVDEKIQQLTRKKELLEQYKKGAMQQLFSGKLRFKDEDGKAFPKWEEKKIKDFVLDKKGAMKIGPFGSQLKKTTFVANGFKVYGQENIFIADFDSGDRYITESHFNTLKTNELYPGDFVISTMGTIGKCCLVPPSIQRGIMDSHMIRLQLNQTKILAKLLGQVFMSYLVQKQVKRFSVGGIMDGLSMGIINKLKFTIPVNIHEQQKVADFLSNIDNKIEIVNKQITQTQTFKKGLLQQMFV